MRLGLAMAALAAVLLPSVSPAASAPVCSGIALLSPASGQHFIGTRPIHFSWSGEPAGTASRDLHLAALDGSEVVTPLDGRFSDTVKVKMAGDLGWAVVFKDAKGRVLCNSPAGLIAAGSGGGKAAISGGASLSTAVAGAAPLPPRLVVGFTNNGRLVIVLQNTPYTGQYSKLVPSDNYDGTNEDLMGAVGIELYANNADNIIMGSPGNDIIRLYAGTDSIDGGGGDDTTYLGPGKKIVSDPAPNDVDQYFAPAGAIISGSLVDNDALDSIFYVENTVVGGVVVDDVSEGFKPVPSVPE
jgi:ribosomal protein S27E